MTTVSGPMPDTGPLPLVAVNRTIQFGVLLAAFVVGFGLAALISGGLAITLGLVFSFLAYLLLIWVVTRIMENAREATNKLMTGVITGSFIVVCFPLVSLMWTVLDRGAARFDSEFFTNTMRGVVGDGGGGVHAITGTLIITGIATLLSVPIGLMTAIYLVEYGGKGRLARWVTTMVDVMTGVPSIVAGLFAYSLFVLITGPGHRSGFAGGVALTVLMTPVVVRTAEEMLRLVPNELREASFALGVSKWRTIVRVVIPTAIAGILTGVTLAIARVIGETAPLLIVAGLAQDTNYNPFTGRMTSLPVMAYYGYQTPGLPPEAGYDRGWAAALTLVIIVATLFFIARVISAVLKPKGLPMTDSTTTSTSVSEATDTTSAPTESATGQTNRIVTTDLDIYYGDFLAVKGVTVEIEPRSITALIGPSGCGKSTFLRSLNRMHEVIPGAWVDGKVELDGVNLYGPGVDPVAVRRRVGMVFQKPNPFPTMSIYENVLAGMRLNSRRLSRSDADAIVEKSLRGANLWEEVKDRLDKPGSGLSGGQQQRLCIARTIAVEPEVVLMDEPCSALDPISTFAIEALMNELKEEFTIVIVTHNMQQAARVSDKTGFFNIEGTGKPGQLVEYDNTDKIFSNPAEQATSDYVTGRFG